MSLLGTIHFQPILNRIELLLVIRDSWSIGRRANYHLRLQAPGGWDLVLGLKTDIDERVIVLQVHPQPLCFQGSPD